MGKWGCPEVHINAACSSCTHTEVGWWYSGKRWIPGHQALATHQHTIKIYVDPGDSSCDRWQAWKTAPPPSVWCERQAPPPPFPTSTPFPTWNNWIKTDGGCSPTHGGCVNLWWQVAMDFHQFAREFVKVARRWHEHVCIGARLEWDYDTNRRVGCWLNWKRDILS